MSLDVYLRKEVTKIQTVYESNITHNLNRMADVAGVYKALRRPDELFENPKAIDLIPILEEGLAKLKSNPTEYKQYNAPNGWGIYEHFVSFVEKYLNACKENPDADVEVSR